MIEDLFCANQEVNDEALHNVMMNLHQPLKPEGTLGRLEEIVVRLAGHQATASPQVKKPKVVIFAADHGMASEDLSEYSAEQAVQWLEALSSEKAPTNALAQFSNAAIELIDVGLKGNLELSDKYLSAKVAASTADFTQTAAMSEQQLLQTLQVGMQAAERAKQEGCDLFISGEIGIANTTSAIALISVLSGKSAEELLLMGRTRIMSSERQKLAAIEQALELHQDQLTSPLRILQHLGGFETAALCGAYIRCAQLGLTIVVDGLMATVAAWIADLVSRNDQLVHCKSVEMLMDLGQYSVPETMFCICGNCPRLVEWCIFSHQSAEKFHALVLEILAVEPLLQFDMKLGQATGSTLVVPLLQQACLVYNSMPKQELPQMEMESDCPI
jgi:nicotinate-nucleotide--dimethylbenzimidazole phosphoribosyltransferase